MALQPFADTGHNDNHGLVVAPYIQVILAAVPMGKILVVEHISGQLAAQDGATVNFIEATVHGENSVVYLPVHFVSGVRQFGPDQGLGRHHQFGSPVGLYVSGGNNIVVSGGATKAVTGSDPGAAISMFASVVGHLVDA
ncbi:hypothetical protein [Mycolicibacterium confluentis]|nr:hypothetical protein [Mycolicibacterium confluentis]MCV7319525.1 hypothetical protein [Mycolicibacterium confluentis]